MRGAGSLWEGGGNERGWWRYGGGSSLEGAELRKELIPPTAAGELEWEGSRAGGENRGIVGERGRSGGWKG